MWAFLVVVWGRGLLYGPPFSFSDGKERGRAARIIISSGEFLSSVHSFPIQEGPCWILKKKGAVAGDDKSSPFFCSFSFYVCLSMGSVHART